MKSVIATGLFSCFLMAGGFAQATEQGSDDGINHPLNEQVLQKRLSGEVDGDKKPILPDLAYAAFQRGQYLTAFELALPRARNGDAAAQTLIAELYEKGLGIRRDKKEAAEWYGIAARSGNREAQFAYALKLLEGKHVPKDTQAGRAMMEGAANAGHPLAMFNHANQIVAERPTSAGYRKALPYYEKAAEKRVADAYYALAVIYREGRANGIEDPEKAQVWLEKAANAGIDTAQVELGIALINGSYGTKDEKLAFNILMTAANEGNVIAQNRIAHMFLQGIGTEPSGMEAAKWHIIARRAGRFDLVLDQFLEGLDNETRSKAISLANRWPGV